MKDTKDEPKKVTKGRAAATEKADGFTADERAAMKERARELKAEGRRGADRADGEREVAEKIAEMKGTDRTLAERVHALVSAAAPGLAPKTWYGMPAWARDGKVVVFFQSAGKFKSRYATLGFSDQAHLDDGALWPTAFALTELGAAEEKKLVALLKKAAG